MSQSEAETDPSSAGPRPSHHSLSRMMKQGRSWSGRERHCFYLNTAPGEAGQIARFANISACSGTDFPDDGRALGLTDWDHDGDLDLWFSNRNAPQLRFMRNDHPDTNHFLALKLQGAGPTTNRDAIGARVEVLTEATSENDRTIKTLRAGDAFLTQSAKWLVFGLGQSTAVHEVIVRWPGGETERFTGLEADRHYRLVEGNPEPEPWHRAAGEPALQPSPPSLPKTTRQARLPMVTLLKLPRLEYESFDGRRRTLDWTSGKPVLLNLWASWCAPCLAELEEFIEREEDLRKAELEVVALAVDGLGGDDSSPTKASAAASRLKLPFAAGRANESLLTLVERLHARLTSMELDLPVPLSMLVDPEGRLAVLYKGPAGVDQVLADLVHAGAPRPERFARSLRLGGISLAATHQSVARAADLLEVEQRFQFAQDLWTARRFTDAAVHFEELLELKPDFAAAINNLGLAYSEQGRFEEAVARFRRVLELVPRNAEASFNLGLALEGLAKPSEAEASYRRALEIDPGAPRVNDALGLFHAKRGRLDQAQLHFTREVEINPGYPEGHNHLGLILLQRGQPAAAQPHFEKAIELAPDHADAHHNLGIVFKRLGKLDHAVSQYRRAIDLKPDFLEAMINLGTLHLQRNEFLDAEAQFRQVLRHQPNSVAARQGLAKIQALKRSGPGGRSGKNR